MASGTIQVPVMPYNRKLLYDTSSNITAINQTINLSDNIENYQWLVLVLFKDSYSSGNKGLLVVPTYFLGNTTYWPLACGGVLGHLRTDASSGAQLKTLTSSYSTLYVRQVFGIK